jgi:uncharacterized protein DUF6611
MRATQMASPLRRGWLRLLDGERPWGSLVVQPDRFGVTRYRLVVFPPGISEPERRRVRLARGWPVWGALVWLACEVFLPQVIGPWTAVAVSTGALVAIAVITTAIAGTPRTQVKSLSAVVSATIHNPDAQAARDSLSRLALMLIDADERLGRGQISAADHELTWWRVYDEIGSSRAD